MPEMEIVIKLRNSAHIQPKIVIGGAAVTKKFAEEIGAGTYAKDAMETVRYVKPLKK